MTPRFLLPLLGLFLFTVTAAAQTNQNVYDDALENGWQDYGWATLNYTNTSPVHGGSDSISVGAAGYQALYLHHAALDTSSLVSLTFWINGGASGGQTLQLQATINGSAQAAVPLAAPTANTWTQVTVTLASLGVAGSSGFDGFWIQNTTGNTLPTFYVDDIVLTGNPPPATIQLTADAGSVLRTIDARTFGVNTAIWDSQLGTDRHPHAAGGGRHEGVALPGRQRVGRLRLVPGPQRHEQFLPVGECVPDLRRAGRRARRAALHHRQLRQRHAGGSRRVGGVRQRRPGEHERHRHGLEGPQLADGWLLGVAARGDAAGQR